MEAGEHRHHHGGESGGGGGGGGRHGKLIRPHLFILFIVKLIFHNALHISLLTLLVF